MTKEKGKVNGLVYRVDYITTLRSMSVGEILAIELKGTIYNLLYTIKTRLKKEGLVFEYKLVNDNLLQIKRIK